MRVVLEGRRSLPSAGSSQQTTARDTCKTAAPASTGPKLMESIKRPARGVITPASSIPAKK